MSLLPDAATFEELVQDCFLTFRGSGLMLSPLDVELIEEWSASGVPFDVIARGIKRAAEGALFDARPGEPPLRSLRACRKQVQAEIGKYLGRSAGRGAAPQQTAAAPPEPLYAVRHRKLIAALKKVAREEPRVAGIGVWVDRVGRPPSCLEDAERLEAAADLALIRALAFEDRLRLLREARALAHNRAALSARSRRVSLRFHRAALLRRTLSLPPYW